MVGAKLAWGAAARQGRGKGARRESDERDGGWREGRGAPGAGAGAEPGATADNSRTTATKSKESFKTSGGQKRPSLRSLSPNRHLIVCTQLFSVLSRTLPIVSLPLTRFRSLPRLRIPPSFALSVSRSSPERRLRRAPQSRTRSERRPDLARSSVGTLGLLSSQITPTASATCTHPPTRLTDALPRAVG